MAELLVLCTYWEADYWENDKEAPYPKRSIEPVEHLKNTLPLAGIGVYTKGKDRFHRSIPMLPHHKKHNRKRKGRTTI